jgi:Protein of unknown function (DUF2778)
MRAAFGEPGESKQMAISDSDPLVQSYLRGNSDNFKEFYRSLNGESMKRMMEVLIYLQMRYGFFPSWGIEGYKVAQAGVDVPRINAAILATYWRNQISYYEFVSQENLPGLVGQDQADELKAFFPRTYPDGSRYAGERGVPTVAQCANVSLLFDGFYLKLLVVQQVDCAWVARSGAVGDGFFDYTIERQKWTGKGPIPQGAYWIRNDEITSPKLPFTGEAWGNYRVTIHPYLQTVTYGRGGFFIHGGATFGSAGCVDLAFGMDDFVAKLKAKVLSPDTLLLISTGEILPGQYCYIPLTVSYAAERVSAP